MSEENTNKKLIQQRLHGISKGKYQIIWAIFVTIVSPFIMPFIKAGDRYSRETISSLIGYWNAVLLSAGIMLPIMSYLIYKEYDKMVRDKFDTEAELRLLKKELKEKR